MTESKFYINWDAGQSTEFCTLDELDQCISALELKYEASPIIAIVGGPRDSSVYFGIGGALSFISSCEVPYQTTVGNVHAEGDRDYFFQGHHSSICNRHLISREFARKALHEFCLTGQFASWQVWEAI